MQGIQIEAIAEVLSEQVGFRRGAVNPDTGGWQDIVEFLFADENIKRVLIERYGDRISDYADRIDAAYDADCDADQRDRRMEGHWAQLAQAITRQHVEGRTM